MKTFFLLIRADHWFFSKIPLLLGIAYSTLLFNGPPHHDTFLSICIVLVAMCSLFAYGHVINDLCDIAEDKAAGKRNLMGNLTPLTRFIVCLFFVVTGFLPMLLFQFHLVPTVILAFNYLEPTIYSAPPIRLKERGIGGVVGDALGAHVLPALFVVTSILPPDAFRTTANVFFCLTAALWSGCIGFRGIIIHQVIDRHNDTLADVVTFGSKNPTEWLRRFVMNFVLPVEFVALFSFLGMLVFLSPILLLFFSPYVIAEGTKIYLGWKLPLFYPDDPHKESYIPLVNNEFYEVWLPLSLLFALCLEMEVFFIVLAFHLLIFKDIVWERIVITGRLIGAMKEHISYLVKG